MPGRQKRRQHIFRNTDPDCLVNGLLCQAILLALLICNLAEPDVLIQDISGSIIPKHLDLHLGASCTLVQIRQVERLRDLLPAARVDHIQLRAWDLYGMGTV